ncbi:MAG: kynureninase [Cellvibrionaceae bacterium]|nr:kynureninase [Cellvibrionaceae bacterium]|tara:strand:+ start:19270 stop:20421 length:1152 start_codon:yes stop_codon:yes gene_type:complete
MTTHSSRSGLIDSSLVEDMFCLNDDIYFLNHSVGKMPRSTETIIKSSYLQPWQTSEGDPWPQWLTVIDKFRQALARLFSANAEDFCPQTNISSGLSKLLASLPLDKSRKTLLYSENDFPSIGFVMEQARRMGFETRCLPADLNTLDINLWEQHLHQDLAAVLIAHSHFNTSKLTPASDICQLARDRGIFSVVDVAQSAGVVPIDLQQLGADAILGSSVKWLCGGSGAGFMWIAPDKVESLKPLDVGWFSHRDPFEFDIHHFDYHQSALRFWGGTPSILPYAVAANSIEIIEKIGVAKIRQHNSALTQRLIEKLNDHTLNTPKDTTKRGGTLVLDLNTHHRDRILQDLENAKVRFDQRTLGIRLSPHIYNTIDQIDLVAEILNS